MNNNSLRDGRRKNWFYLENDLLDREDLNIYEKTVYIVIARYVNGENKAFPSYETIAKKGSMSKVQAMRVVKSLIEKGLIKKESRINKDNKGYTSDLYTLLNPKPKNKSQIVPTGIKNPIKKCFMLEISNLCKALGIPSKKLVSIVKTKLKVINLKLLIASSSKSAETIKIFLIKNGDEMKTKIPHIISKIR